MNQAPKTKPGAAKPSNPAPDFTKPTEVDRVSLAFPTSVRRMLPEYGGVPSEFKNGTTKWSQLISDWFFCGLKGYSFTPKPGIDPNAALRHVAYCLGSYEPKHEHKEAGCAYLMSLWFEDFSKASSPAAATEVL